MRVCRIQSIEISPNSGMQEWPRAADPGDLSVQEQVQSAECQIGR